MKNSLLYRICPVHISSILPRKWNENQMNTEQRQMLSLIWKESFRNSGSRWSAASQASLMLVRKYALSDNNKHMAVLVEGWLCIPAPRDRRKQGSNYLHDCHGSWQWSWLPPRLAPLCLWTAPGSLHPHYSSKTSVFRLSFFWRKPHKAHGVKTANHPSATPLW